MAEHSSQLSCRFSYRFWSPACIVYLTISDRLLDTMLGFAAGAMLFVIADEMIPESHKKRIPERTDFWADSRIYHNDDVAR